MDRNSLEYVDAIWRLLLAHPEAVSSALHKRSPPAKAILKDEQQKKRDHPADSGSRGASGLMEEMEEQRKEEWRNVQLLVALVEHASRCTSTECTSSKCMKMKSHLKHWTTCKVSNAVPEDLISHPVY